ncbi:MAG: hypothetical protein WCK75_04415 [Elusimicrobiota bacterium]
MKKFFCSLPVLVLCMAAPVFAVEFQDADAALAVDFPSGWVTGRSDDSTVALKLEKGKSFFEFSKLDSELSDYYLKARVKEQVDSLRSKGNSLSGDIRQAGIHGVSTAYYVSYESMDAQMYIGFFTYNGLSYAISATGLDDSDFRNAVSTIRKPGEKIDVPKPKKIKVARKSKPEPEESGVQIFKEDEPSVSTETVASSTPEISSGTVAADPQMMAPVAESSGPSVGTMAIRKTWKLFSGFTLSADPARTPFVARQPLTFYVWGALMALWIAGALWAKMVAARFQNPKLPPPPKDVPPDFFFPFVISRKSSLRECTYNVLTRQRQLLLASFDFKHELYLAGSVYFGIFFHIFWSLLAFVGKGNLVINFLLNLPGGRLWASVPEVFFAIPFIAGLFIYFKRTQVLRLYDSQSNLLMEAKKDVFYCLIRDGNGQEISRLMKKGGLSARTWDFVDTDNQIVFTIRDDYPATHILRKIFGRLGGALRSRYGIFAAERRAGFVFLDPTSADRFQIHLNFDFARLAHPAQILASILYIVSKENDPFYPSPF